MGELEGRHGDAEQAVDCRWNAADALHYRHEGDVLHLTCVALHVALLQRRQHGVDHQLHRPVVVQLLEGSLLIVILFAWKKQSGLLFFFLSLMTFFLWDFMEKK